jgi:ABC-type dipeptide/oligopeptide/nickel transport system ATPase component
MKIVSLKANNILKIKAIFIEADGKSVTLSGKNGSGKTSVMRAITMALAGADSIAEKPIHGDEEDARVILNLGDLVVTRTFHKTDNKTTLTVTSPEGAKYPKPQNVLDALCGKLSFDPLEFARMGQSDPGKQLKTLKSLVGLDFSELDMKRQGLFDERTMVGRDVKAAESKTSGKSIMPGLPDAPVSVADLMKQLQDAQTANRAIDEADQSLRNDAQALMAARDELTRKKKEIADLEARLEALQADLEKFIAAGKIKADALAKRRTEVEAMKRVDTAPISQKITNADATNADIRANIQLKTDQESVTRHTAKYDGLTKQIEAIDEDKQAQLKAAKFPLKGLCFTDTGVTLDGIPFDQCSTGDQIRASAAIGIALNPKLKVLLIRDASMLDKDNLALLAGMAKEHDVQLWLESVSDSEEVAVTIEGEGK